MQKKRERLSQSRKQMMITPHTTRPTKKPMIFLFQSQARRQTTPVAKCRQKVRQLRNLIFFLDFQSNQYLHTRPRMHARTHAHTRTRTRTQEMCGLINTHNTTQKRATP